MTKEEIVQNIQELIDNDKDYIQKQIQKAIDSGAIDIEKYEGRMVWPKIILAAIYGELEWQYTQIHKWKKDIENVKTFL